METTKQEQFNRACYYGDIKTIKLLINDPDVQPDIDRINFVIRLAARHGYKEIVELLIQDSRVDPSDDFNNAIRIAAEYGQKEIVELLMQDSRVDPSDGDNHAIRYAADQGHKQVVELLLTDERVMDNIEYAFKWCKEYGNYELLKACVDEHKRELKRQEKERRVREAIEGMSADCELYF